jgi:hypothetical protein
MTVQPQEDFRPSARECTDFWVTEIPYHSQASRNLSQTADRIMWLGVRGHVELLLIFLKKEAG